MNISEEELPVIQSVEPDSGAFGTSVTIRGERFADLAERIEVAFNGVEAEIGSITDNEIEVQVPKRSQSGPVTLQIGNQTVQGPVFNYLLTVTVTTEAGSGIEGNVNGPQSEARFNEPWGIEIDNAGSAFISDYHNTAIKKVYRGETVSTFASGFTSNPMGLALGVNGTLYVAGSFNNLVHAISPSGEVSRFAGSGFIGDEDGDKLLATFNVPADIAIRQSDLTLYVADAFNNKIRVITPDGKVSTLAGLRARGYRNGPGPQALFYRPVSLALNAEETELYVSDLLNHRIRKVDLSSGFVSNLAGDGVRGFRDGPAEEARFNEPLGITVDRNGTVYVADSENHSIRMIKDGKVTTLAGTNEPGLQNGSGKEARFNEPYHLVINRNGGSVLFVVDRMNNLIRRVRIE
ncbi:MAG: IPT/TIG domain-containing protein [Balneolaceae bacterium]|nr:IPT/TIG domain-containing protein [Balneolaceae bacterium]